MLPYNSTEQFHSINCLDMPATLADLGDKFYEQILQSGTEALCLQCLQSPQKEVLPLAVTAKRLGADPKATSTGVVVMLCFMKPMFLALTSVSLKSLMTLSSQAVANAEPSALKASPPTLSVCPCSSMLLKLF